MFFEEASCQTLFFEAKMHFLLAGTRVRAGSCEVRAVFLMKPRAKGEAHSRSSGYKITSFKYKNSARRAFRELRLQRRKFKVQK